MYCSECGKEINNNSKFCSFCGVPIGSFISLSSIQDNSLNIHNNAVVLDEHSAPESFLISELSNNERNEFFVKVYSHVLKFIILFALLSWFLFNIGFGNYVLDKISENRYYWLMILAGAFLSEKIADYFSDSEKVRISYFGPSLSIISNALLFSPLFSFAYLYGPEGVIGNATIASILMILTLIVTAHFSKTNFSALKSFLFVGSVLGLALIVFSILMNFTLGLLFSYAMILLASSYILYDVSNIIRVYDKNQYLSASIRLFNSILFFYWYVLRIFSNDD